MIIITHDYHDIVHVTSQYSKYTMVYILVTLQWNAAETSKVYSLFFQGMIHPPPTHFTTDKAWSYTQPHPLPSTTSPRLLESNDLCLITGYKLCTSSDRLHIRNQIL